MLLISSRLKVRRVWHRHNEPGDASFRKLAEEELGVNAAIATYIGVAPRIDGIEPELVRPRVRGLKDSARTRVPLAALVCVDAHVDHSEAA